ncbi:hypothetical protein M8C21_002027 [Ambrosia artemisiifolia]|uniref:Uncharacterized protein n=1 Tax=Ambrosia artemisiifolia TaxID=4212 RepID=A0AAD5GLG0_AMBAR|nr:hypothetical protein M8C21_002027 [Ambrosia artemisiifolia]
MINHNEPWVAAAVTTDALVADLLLRLKRSSSSPPLHTPPSTPAPPGWGDRKSRSKGHQQKGPTTLLSWNDGYDDSSRSSDLYSGNRSLKIDLHEDRKKEWESGSESEMMMKRRRRCMLPDLNETPPAQAYE